MRKPITIGFAAGMLVVATTMAALAIDTTLRINFIDPEARIITLGGDQVLVPEGFDVSTLNIGMLVTATYDDAGQEPYQATEITIR